MDIMWGGAIGEIQLHAMDWWAIREQRDGSTSDSDEGTDTKQGEGDCKKVSKKPREAAGDRAQERGTWVSESGGIRAGGKVQQTSLSTYGGIRSTERGDSGRPPRPEKGMQDDRGSNPERGDMRLANHILMLVRGSGEAGTTGETMARALPRTLEINIREVIDNLT